MTDTTQLIVRYWGAFVYFCKQQSNLWKVVKALASGRITQDELDDDTIGRCESCAKIFQLDNAIMSEDGCYFCPECVTRWNEDAA